jgi:hypothetical protein
MPRLSAVGYRLAALTGGGVLPTIMPADSFGVWPYGVSILVEEHPMSLRGRRLGSVTPGLVLVALMAAPSAVSPAEPATLGIDDIVRGIEENQKAWKSQTSWMVRYAHMRESVQPPPGQMVEFPDVELVNARKGPALYIFYRQPPIGKPDQKHERWMLWTDGHYTERTGQRAYKQDEPAPQIFSYYWYPFGLSRDLFSDAIPISEEAFNDPELSLVLPRCLKVNKGEYIVRKNVEEIDGYQCRVLERSGKDIIWIDAKRGFNVCRRTILQPSGNVLAEFKATGWTEKAKGIWLPKRQLSIAFNFDADPKEYRGKVRFVMTNTLLETRFNDLPDSFFEVPLPKGVTFEDRRKGKKP